MAIKSMMWDFCRLVGLLKIVDSKKIVWDFKEVYRLLRKWIEILYNCI